MKDPEPQDPAPWAAKILALKHAEPFQAFNVVMVSGYTVHVDRPEYVEILESGVCAKVSGPQGLRCALALQWVVDIEIGGEIGAPPRPPRYAAKLRALQQDGPMEPLVLTTRDGRRFSFAGPHEFLVAPDGRSVAVCDREGLAIVSTSEISELEPAT